MSRNNNRDKRRNDRTSSDSGSDDGRGRIDEKLPTVSFGGLVMVNLRDPAKPIEIPKSISSPQPPLQQQEALALPTSSTQDYLNSALARMQSGKEYQQQLFSQQMQPQPAVANLTEQQKYAVQIINAQNVHGPMDGPPPSTVEVTAATATTPPTTTFTLPTDEKKDKPFLDLGGLFSTGLDWTPAGADWGESIASQVASFGLDFTSSMEKEEKKSSNAISPPPPAVQQMTVTQQAPTQQQQAQNTVMDIKVEAGPAPSADSKTKSTLRSTAAEFVPATKPETPPTSGTPAAQAPRQQNFTFIHSIGAYAAVIPRRPAPQQYIIRAQPGQNVQQVIDQLMREGVGAHQLVIQQAQPPKQ